MSTPLLAVPYHLGRKDIGVGRGPGHLLAGEPRHEIHPDNLPASEVDAIVAVNKTLAEALRRSSRALPMVLSGDCNSCLGTLSGLDSSNIGIIWFDAHGDMNTPATSPSGFFDGMSISIALGDCYPDVWSQLGNTKPILAENVLLVATRDLDPLERPRIDSSPVQMVQPPEMDTGLEPKLDALAGRVTEVYLHFDIDALDPEFAPGAGYRCPGGISLVQARRAIGMIGDRFRIRAAAFTNFNPDHEEDGKTLTSVSELYRAMTDAASSPARNLRSASS